MASGPYWNPKRGTWSVQYWSGGWHRVVVIPKQPGRKTDDGKTPKIPPEAHAALARLAKVEQAARQKTRSAAPASLQAFLDAHLDTYTGRTRESVLVTNRGFLEWCKTRKILRVEQVTTDACSEWVEAIGQTYAIATVRRRIQQLSVAWNRAVRRGKLAANPWLGVEPRGRPERASRGSWTPAQFDRLLAASKPWLRDLLVVGTHTGLRISALIGLEWRDIEWADQDAPGFGWVRVRVELDKAKKGYRVPVGPRLHDVLARRFLGHGHPFVCAGHRGRPIVRRDVTAQAIHSACRRAGLGKPDSPNHHMRRSFGRWAVFGHLTGTPVPLYVVSRWLGHASVAMTLKYLDITEDDSTRFMLGTGPEPTTPPPATPPNPQTS